MRRQPRAPALLLLALASGCDEPAPAEPARSRPTEPASSTPSVPAAAPAKVDFQDTAMGTTIHFVAYTNQAVDEKRAQQAMLDALKEIRRLEALMSSWRDDTDVGRINQHAGSAVKVSRETLEVVQKSIWAGKLSQGTFDITFESMSGLWKFGEAMDEHPRPPDPKQVAALKKKVDYRKIAVDAEQSTIAVPEGSKLSLGGIAKGYAVDKAAAILVKAGLTSFLVQAGGDLYGAGTKPDGSPWVSGIRDPRGPDGVFFATVQLNGHAFSTAGDYARSYLYEGKRYHHIIDPRTGYPAEASRSVTVWAKDAFLADAIDDAVFILGPEQGLKIIESIDGAGAVIVDAKNKVWVSKRLEGKVKLLRQPSDGI